MARLTKQDYQQIAKEKNVKWLAKELPRKDKSSWRNPCETKQRYQCNKCKHIWLTSYSNLKRGFGCPKCARKISNENLEKSRPQRKKQHYVELASKMEFKHIGKAPRYTNQKSKWLCLKCKQCQQATYSTMLNAHRLGLRNCMSCWKVSDSLKQTSANRRLKEKDYIRLAKESSLIWVGKELPNNTYTKTEWQCKKCNAIEGRTYNNLSRGKRCTSCINFVNGKRVSVVQVKLAEFLKAELNYKLGSRYVDCAFPDKKIAIEYDSYYYHGDRDDRPRNKDILDAGWKLWRIRSNSAIPKKHTAEYAINQLETTDRTHFVTTLKDWGHGPLWHQVKEEKDVIHS